MIFFGGRAGDIEDMGGLRNILDCIQRNIIWEILIVYKEKQKINKSKFGQFSLFSIIFEKSGPQVGFLEE